MDNTGAGHFGKFGATSFPVPGVPFPYRTQAGKNRRRPGRRDGKILRDHRQHSLEENMNVSKSSVHVKRFRWGHRL